MSLYLFLINLLKNYPKLSRLRSNYSKENTGNMDKIKEDIFEVSKLVATELAGLLTDAEKRRLDLWRSESEENERLYRRLSQKGGMQGNFERIGETDSWKALEQMRLRIGKQESKRRGKMVWSISAVLAAACFVAGILLFRQASVTDPAGTAARAEANYPTLTMADGNVVRLDTMTKVITAQGMTLEVSGGSRMIYNADVETAEGEADGRHTIYVPRGTTFDIQFSDGTRAWLNADSRISFPSRFASHERRVEIEGEVYFEVEGNREVPFVVETRGQSVIVFGTEFNVNAYGNRVVTTLLNGRVTVVAQSAKADLLPGEQSVFSADSGTIETHAVDAGEYASWRDGYFVLEGQSLESIMKAIGRWYDVDIVWRDPSLHGMEFTGRLPRFDSVEHTLAILEMTREVAFTYKDGRVEVGSKTGEDDTRQI